ncbi:helix-turn-helix domain-containing protein [Rhodococcus sp. G-MC3]|uniref:PucR family transcriptional regulator n=1 Tax=Rhodococcus sp. G-MC3 TaxID=3046209 RepID=UPI0024BADC1A|nr:helix-turn-helix domain-containing protein [Rhodococcus sp. G-MC3]MDJ0395810.1 helix-turn-helix domain-containing protein [Rhodococcus sp. G-MC3]
MHPARDIVAARIDGRMQTVVATAVDAIREAIPAYRDLRGAQLADVEAITYWSLRRLLQLWSGGRDTLDDRDQARFRAIGVARASDGRPLTDVLRAYRVASSVFVRHVATEYLNDLEPGDIAELSVVLIEGIDLISEAIIDAYTSARGRLLSDRSQARAALLDDLIAGRQSSPGALADRSRELALDLPDRPHILVVQSLETSRPPSDDAVDAAVEALVGTGSQLCTRRSLRAIFLLPNTITPEDIESLCRTMLLRGCMISGHPIGDVGTAYRLAEYALDTAPEHAYGERSVLDEGDAQLLALLTARPSADTGAVVASILGPLADPANDHILAGLASFISTGTATAAAAALLVHPQTLRYRLRRARELTGRDPRNGWHRLALDTAIQLRQLSTPRSSRRH